MAVCGAGAAPPMPVIGFLSSRSPDTYASLLVLSTKASKAGVAGRDVVIEFRWAEGHYDRLPMLAAELVQRQVLCIVAVRPPSALAAKTATSAISIVFPSVAIR